MKIYTLGTSHGATEYMRSCSANLIEVGGSYYLFDCGGDAESKIHNLGIKPNSVRAIFLSHMHLDHVTSLPGMAKWYALHYNKTEAHADVFFPEEEGINGFLSWMSTMHASIPRAKMEYFEMKTVTEGLIYDDGTVKVTAIPTRHIQGGKFPSFAYMIEGEGKRMLYTGDLAPDFSDYPKVLFEKDFDAVLSELVHFSVENNLPDIIRTKTKKLIFTHLGPSKIPPMQEAIGQFPYPVYIANDLDVFEV
jgi:ribonuclease BN (tRNA processing enzyme)